MARSLKAQLALATRAALVGGLIFGLRESFEALERNAVAFASHYIWLYAVVPIQLWVLFALVLTLPAAFLIAALDPQASAGRKLWRYAAGLGLAGGLSALMPWAAQIEARMAAVGVAGSAVTIAIVCCTAVGAIVIAVVLAAASQWYESRTRKPLRFLSAAVAALCLAGLLPVGHFFANEAQWRAAEAKHAVSADALPNVLLISIDTLRADVIGDRAWKTSLTPNLDRLARDGVRFDQAITSSSWTLPAMASLFTGLNVRRHNAGWVTNARDPLGRAPLVSDLWNLNTELERHGYATAAIVTNPYLAVRYGFANGFDTYENLSIRAEIVVAFEHTTLMRAAAWLVPALLPGDRGPVVTDRAIRWLRQRPVERPFYLWVHYIDPHAPYAPGADVRVDSFRGDSLLGGADDADFGGGPPDIARLRSGEVRPDEVQKAQLRELYKGEVRGVDATVGRLLDELDALHLAPSTLVVVLADHGEEFWEHGGVEHGHTVYEEVVRVPLLMRWPGRIPPGTTVSMPVGLIDVAPTLLDLLGQAAPAGIDGRSLKPAIDGEPLEGSVLLIESMHFAEERLGLRTATNKYVRWRTGKEEAYDLVVDPNERVDLAGDTALVAALRSLAERNVAAAPAVIPGGAVRPTAATREALRALGYLD